MAQKINLLFIGFWLLLGILACPVQAQTKKSTPKTQIHNSKKSKKKTLTLQGLIQKALTEGHETYYPNVLGSFIDLPGDVAVQSFRVSSASATDEMVHSFKVVVEESTSTEKPTPLKLLFTSTYYWPGNDEQYVFKANLDALLEKVITMSGKHSPDGKAVKGSGVVLEKDIDSPEIKERFQHELDFWLKEKYRKPKS